MTTTLRVLRACGVQATVAPAHGCLIAEIDPGRGNLLWTDGRQPRSLEPSGMVGEASAREFDDDVLVGGWFPMFPNAGMPTATTQQHGWAPRVAWTVLDGSDTRVVCSVTGPFLDGGVAQLTRTVQLESDSITVTTVVRNIGRGVRSFTWGEHPCFAREAFAEGHAAFEGERVIAVPTVADGGAGHLSRHASGASAAVVGRMGTVTLTDVAETMPHWVLWYNYAADELPRADTLAWEPSTAAGLGVEEALASDTVHRLSPDERFHAILRCEWTLSTIAPRSVR